MIDEKNFIQRALKCYDNPQCVSLDEFESDLHRFSMLKRFITMFAEGGILTERLILNHLVICYNLFGNDATSFLLYKIEPENWGILFPFLILLDRLPENIDEIKTSDIVLNQEVIDILRKL